MKWFPSSAACVLAALVAACGGSSGGTTTGSGSAAPKQSTKAATSAAPSAHDTASHESAAPSASAAPSGSAASSGDMTDEEALAFNDKFAALFDHAEDCDKLAQAVEKFYEDNKDTIATMKELEKKDPARKKAMQEKYKERLEPIRKKQTDAMQKCHDNAKLGEALKHYM